MSRRNFFRRFSDYLALILITPFLIVLLSSAAPVLRRIIGEVWQARPIGAQIRMDELWGAVRQMPNVRRVLRLLAEGAYDEQGQARLAPLEKDSAFPYAVVENGVHTVRVQ